jgi:hypothetical protein
MVITLHSNIGVRGFGVFFLYRKVSCVTIIYSQDSRILGVVGGSGVTWRFERVYQFVNTHSSVIIITLILNYNSKNIPESLSENVVRRSQMTVTLSDIRIDEGVSAQTRPSAYSPVILLRESLRWCIVFKKS